MRSNLIVTGLCVAIGTSGCLSTGGGIGANSLVAPLTQKSVQLVGYGADAAMDKVFGAPEEPESMSTADILAKVDETCIQNNLSDTDCDRMKNSAAQMAALAMNVQQLDAIAQDRRAQQRATAFSPGSILRDVGGAAVGHQLMLEKIDTIH